LMGKLAVDNCGQSDKISNFIDCIISYHGMVIMV
jgi:hypothetical protein